MKTGISHHITVPSMKQVNMDIFEIPMEFHEQVII